MTEPTPTPDVTPQAPAGGLEIAAIVTAFVVAPVGIILGVVSRSTSKKAGQRPNTLATVSIVVGSIVTAISVLSILIPLVVVAAAVGGAASAAERQAECAPLVAQQPTLDAYAAYVPPTEVDEPRAAFDEYASQSTAANSAANAVLAADPSDQRLTVAATDLADITQSIVWSLGSDDLSSRQDAIFNSMAIGQAGDLSAAITAYCSVDG